MIQIEERKTKKVVGETSLFVKFNYRKELVDFLKTLSGFSYDKETREWEIPLVYLSKLIDGLCIYDKIDIQFLPPEKEEDTDYSKIDLDTYKYPPFAYQAEGIKYGLVNNKWLLLYDMGLGKTLVITYLANELKRRGEISHCLIICGVNSLKNNWRREIQKFTDLSCTILGERVTKTGNRVVGGVKERIEHLKRPIEEFFVITNIETLRSKEVTNAILKGPNKFDMIAVDEIHRCSSDQSSQQAQGLLRLNKAKYRIGATGTLITNNPLNAYVPLKWIGAERSIFTNYKNFYCEFNDSFHSMISGVKNMDFLRYTIEKHSLRKTKDILELPDKTVINEYVDMDERQAKFYENIKGGVKDQVDKVELKTTNVLAMVARLRQATACPSMLTTENIPSAKIERAVDMASQIIEGGDKVVIFSTFKETVRVLADKLSNYKPLIGTGDMKDSDVSINIDRFQSDKNCKLFIATWQKCGTGFTLTASRYLIFIDIPFTNASYEQAQDRIYRIGTKESVFIYHLITNGTVDERVLEIVEDKEALSDYLVDGVISRNGISKLTSYIENL